MNMMYVQLYIYSIYVFFYISVVNEPQISTLKNFSPLVQIAILNRKYSRKNIFRKLILIKSNYEQRLLTGLGN